MSLGARRDALRAKIVARLQESEERSLPLSLLGNEEFRALRKGLGTLSKVLRQFDDVLEVLEAGSPPEQIARLLPSPEAPSAEAKTSESDSESRWQRARCRVVAVLERRSVGRDLVAVLCPLGAPEGAAPLKAQPRDQRLPAFWLQELPRAEAEAEAEAEPGAGLRGRRRLGAQEAAWHARTGAASREALLRAAEAQGGGLLCVVRFLGWPRASLSPHAEVVEVLGPLGSVAAESDALLAFYGLEWRGFSEEMERSLRERFPSSAAVVEKELANGRRDLRHVPCVTIDPPTARDLDDAVSVEPGPLPGTFRVGVHVADVAHFVPSGGALDLEARRRATTVYLVGRVYPMLPRWLSENLCSLLPEGDRLAMSVFFTLDGEGRVLGRPEFLRGVIRTRARLSYNDVDLALEDGGPGLAPELLKALRTLAELTTARRRLRVGGGAVVLARSQFFFHTDAEGRVSGIEREPSASVSHSLIEELMVLANHLAASRLLEHAAEGGASCEAELPQPLLRRHPNTEVRVRERVLEVLPPGLRAAAPDAPLPGLLEWCRQHWSAETHEAVCADVLKAFKEAEYVVADLDGEASESMGHWALSLPSYMHFTSPIRRYADILVHRRLSRLADGAAHGRTDAQAYRDFLSGLREAVATCNNKKRDAQDAGLDSVQLALSSHVHALGGLHVPDAVITRILVPTMPCATEPAEGGKPLTFHRKLRTRVLKHALEFYVPVAQCARSVSFDVLGIEFVSSTVDKVEDGGAGTVRSVRVRPKGADSTEVELRVLERLDVRLVSEQTGDGGPRRWTVRLPWATGATERVQPEARVPPTSAAIPLPQPGPPAPPATP